ncbi:MAG: hypothetical protein HY814_01795, partial [Candidatus Riflebacteria bacterium]|nr:hypothetical protein [Candidatus Riflebacteria bacterium]
LDHEWGHQAASIAKRILQSYLQYREMGPERFAETLRSIKAAPGQYARSSSKRPVARKSKSKARGAKRIAKSAPQKLARSVVN